jgi:hypothetical protein
MAEAEASCQARVMEVGKQGAVIEGIVTKTALHVKYFRNPDGRESGGDGLLL